ncbi:MAG: imidazoleglycerol-phosphate dehydratase [Synergistaceae bacterium]|nr:imidazoleglycerol-phosphate dehydratase [Synergistaceae bacterium]
MRECKISRTTKETDIKLSLELDGTGISEIKTGCGFLDHMLTLFASHGKFNLNIFCEGDTYVDYHHTVEDVGICLGQAFLKALGDKKGINRYGNFILPMDEALILTAIDFSRRSYLNWDMNINSQKV